MIQACAVSLLALFVLGGVFWMPSPDVVEAEARRTYEGGEYQRDLPDADPATARPQNEPVYVRRRRRRSDEALMRDVGSALLWALLGVSVVLGALWVARRLPGREARVRAPVAPFAPGAAPPAPTTALADAEALADAGRHDEAIHALLLVAVEELGRQDRLAVSATSREILDEVPSDGGVHDAFARLVEAVEWSLFGGRPADASDFERCRASYLALHAKLGGAAS